MNLTLVVTLVLLQQVTSGTFSNRLAAAILNSYIFGVVTFFSGLTICVTAIEN